MLSRRIGHLTHLLIMRNIVKGKLEHNNAILCYLSVLTIYMVTVHETCYAGCVGLSFRRVGRNEMLQSRCSR